MGAIKLFCAFSLECRYNNSIFKQFRIVYCPNTMTWGILCVHKDRRGEKFVIRNLKIVRFFIQNLKRWKSLNKNLTRCFFFSFQSLTRCIFSFQKLTRKFSKSKSSFFINAQKMQKMSFSLSKTNQNVMHLFFKILHAQTFLIQNLMHCKCFFFTICRVVKDLIRNLMRYIFVQFKIWHLLKILS